MDLPSFACGMCGKCFADAGQLQQHIQTHTGQQPFRCIICWPLFYDMSNKLSQPCVPSMPVASFEDSNLKQAKASIGSKEDGALLAAATDTEILHRQQIPAGTAVKETNLQTTHSPNELSELEGEKVSNTAVDKIERENVTATNVEPEDLSKLDTPRMVSVATGEADEVLKQEPMVSSHKVASNLQSECETAVVTMDKNRAEEQLQSDNIENTSETVTTSFDKETEQSLSGRDSTNSQNNTNPSVAPQLKNTDSGSNVICQEQPIVAKDEKSYEDKVASSVEKMDLASSDYDTVEEEECNLTAQTQKENRVVEVKEVTTVSKLNEADVIPDNIAGHVQTSPWTNSTPGSNGMKNKSFIVTHKEITENVSTQGDKDVTGKEVETDDSAERNQPTPVDFIDLTCSGIFLGDATDDACAIAKFIGSTTPGQIAASVLKVPSCDADQGIAQVCSTDQSVSPVVSVPNPPGSTSGSGSEFITAPVVEDLRCIQYSLEELLSSADFARQQILEPEFGANQKASQHPSHSSGHVESTPTSIHSTESVHFTGRRKKGRPKKLACDGTVPPFVAEQMYVAALNDHMYCNQSKQDTDAGEHQMHSQTPDISSSNAIDNCSVQVKQIGSGGKSAESVHLRNTDDKRSKDNSHTSHQKSASDCKDQSECTTTGAQQQRESKHKDGKPLPEAKSQDTSVNFQGVIKFLKNVQFKKSFGAQKGKNRKSMVIRTVDAGRVIRVQTHSSGVSVILPETTDQSAQGAGLSESMTTNAIPNSLEGTAAKSSETVTVGTLENSSQDVSVVYDVSKTAPVTSINAASDVTESRTQKNVQSSQGHLSKGSDVTKPAVVSPRTSVRAENISEPVKEPATGVHEEKELQVSPKVMIPLTQSGTGSSNKSSRLSVSKAGMQEGQTGNSKTRRGRPFKYGISFTESAITTPKASSKSKKPAIETEQLRSTRASMKQENVFKKSTSQLKIMKTRSKSKRLHSSFPILQKPQKGRASKSRSFTISDTKKKPAMYSLLTGMGFATPIATSTPKQLTLKKAVISLTPVSSMNTTSIVKAPDALDPLSIAEIVAFSEKVSHSDETFNVEFVTENTSANTSRFANDADSSAGLHTETATASAATLPPLTSSSNMVTISEHASETAETQVLASGEDATPTHVKSPTSVPVTTTKTQYPDINKKVLSPNKQFINANGAISRNSTDGAMTESHSQNSNDNIAVTSGPSLRSKDIKLSERRSPNKNKGITLAETQVLEKTSTHVAKISNEVEKKIAGKFPQSRNKDRLRANPKMVSATKPTPEIQAKTPLVIPELIFKKPLVCLSKMSESICQNLFAGKTVNVSQTTVNASRHVEPSCGPVQPARRDSLVDVCGEHFYDQEASDSDRTFLYGDEDSFSDSSSVYLGTDSRRSPENVTNNILVSEQKENHQSYQFEEQLNKQMDHRLSTMRKDRSASAGFKPPEIPIKQTLKASSTVSRAEHSLTTNNDHRRLPPRALKRRRKRSRHSRTLSSKTFLRSQEVAKHQQSKTTECHSKDAPSQVVSQNDTSKEERSIKQNKTDSPVKRACETTHNEQMKADGDSALKEKPELAGAPGSTAQSSTYPRKRRLKRREKWKLKQRKLSPKQQATVSVEKASSDRQNLHQSEIESNSMVCSDPHKVTVPSASFDMNMKLCPGEMCNTEARQDKTLNTQDVLSTPASQSGNVENQETSVTEFSHDLDEPNSMSEVLEECEEYIDLPKIKTPRRRTCNKRNRGYFWRLLHSKTSEASMKNSTEENSTSISDEAACPKVSEESLVNETSTGATVQTETNSNMQCETMYVQPSWLPSSPDETECEQVRLSSVQTPHQQEKLSEWDSTVNFEEAAPTQDQSTDSESASNLEGPEIFTPSVAESVKRSATRRTVYFKWKTGADNMNVEKAAVEGAFSNVLASISTATQKKPKGQGTKDSTPRTSKRASKKINAETHTSTNASPHSDRLGKIISIPCKMCPAKFKKYAKYVQHLRNGCKERFVCKVCGNTFGRRESLKIHEKIHTGEAAVCCSICGKKLSGPNSLVTHMRIHTDERPYKCPDCPKTFRQPAALSSHYRTHTRDRPFECNICGKAYRFSKNLSSHRLTHTGERPYVCHICNASYYQYGALNVHLKVHSGERPFACDYCAMRFVQKSHLVKHIRQVHTHKIREEEYRKAKTNSKPHLCSKCNRGFTTVASMRRHMKSFCFLSKCPELPNEVN